MSHSKQLAVLKRHIGISAPLEPHTQDMAQCGRDFCMNASYKGESCRKSVGMWGWDPYKFAAQPLRLEYLSDSSSHMDRCIQPKEKTHTLHTHLDDNCSHTCDSHMEASWDTPSHRRILQLRGSFYQEARLANTAGSRCVFHRNNSPRKEHCKADMLLHGTPVDTRVCRNLTAAHIAGRSYVHPFLARCTFDSWSFSHTGKVAEVQALYMVDKDQGDTVKCKYAYSSHSWTCLEAFCKVLRNCEE